MKTLFKTLTIATIMLFVATACEPKDKDLQTRTIVYTVQDETSAPKTEQVTLHSDSEWNALLDRFFTFAEQGSRVSFYNADRAKGSSTAAGQSKDSHTISTTNREEFKRWCREMENLGLTVVIDYDRNTGTWTGTAYSIAPPQSGWNHIVTYVSVRGMDGSLDDCVWVNRVIISVDTVYHTLFITKMGNFINMPTGIFYNARVNDTLLTYHAPHSDDYDTLIFKRLCGDTILLSQMPYCSTAYLDHIDYCKFVPTDEYELWVMMQDYQTWWHYVTMHISLNSCSPNTYSFIGQMDVMSYPDGNWVFFKDGPFECEGGLQTDCETCDEGFNFINSLGETHFFLLERINADFVIWSTLDQRQYTFMRSGCAQYFPQ